jgi:hypothetical protein
MLLSVRTKRLSHSVVFLSTLIAGGAGFAAPASATPATPRPGSISGTVFNDLNKNKRQDATEPAIVGGSVALRAGTSLVGTRPTNAAGLYTFENLSAATYTVEVTLPDGFTAVTTTSPLSIVLRNGANRTGANIGVYQPTSVISGVVFNDANKNRRQDAGELGLAGANVFVQTATEEFIGSRTTDETGAYSFAALDGGSYNVIVAPLDPYNLNTTPSPLAVRVGNGATKVVNLGLHQPTGVVNGVVFGDTNQNRRQDAGEVGLEGVFVDISVNGAIVATRRTDASGAYLADGLDNGRYTVAVQSRPGDTITTLPSRTFYLGIGAAKSLNFGVFRAPSSISGVAFNDLNRNGIREADEPGLAGLVVNAHGASSSAPPITVTTGDDGSYSFPGLTGDNYTLWWDAPPAGFAPTHRLPLMVLLAAGQNFTTGDFSFADPTQGV